LRRPDQVADLVAERQDHAHPEPGRAARVIRARQVALQIGERHVMAPRVLPPDDVHHHVAVAEEVPASRTHLAIDPWQLVRRVARLLDVREQARHVAVPDRRVLPQQVAAREVRRTALITEQDAALRRSGRCRGGARSCANKGSNKEKPETAHTH
jgi:hypothetical protein